MSAIDDIVTINISQSTRPISRRAFGWAMILGAHTKPSGRFKWYSKADWATEMAADGFLTTEDIYTAVSKYFAQTPSPTKVGVGQISGVETTTQALDAVLAEDGDWYGLVLIDKTAANQKLAMAWAETNKRLFVTSAWDSNIFDVADGGESTSIAYYAKANAYKYTAVLATTGSLYPEAAWFGRCLPKDPGTINWAHKTLASVTVDKLTTTQRTNAHAKYASTYEAVGGVNVTEEGWTGSGDFLDVRQALDWLEATLQADIWAALARTDKVPYTDDGIKVIETEVRAVLKQATDNGVLADFDSSQGDHVTFPAAADATTANKTTRTLVCPNCFSRRLAGNLNHITVNGDITV